MRAKYGLVVLALVALSACGGSTGSAQIRDSSSATVGNLGPARPLTLLCKDSQTVFACQARWSDDSLKAIEFPNSGDSHSGQSFIDRQETRDNYGNVYCIALFSDGQGSFHGGNCVSGGISQAPVQTSRHEIDSKCRITMTFYDEYERPSRYSLQITTYYSDGTQISIDQDSSNPC
jgi:hypothetical protein